MWKKILVLGLLSVNAFAGGGSVIGDHDSSENPVSRRPRAPDVAHFLVGCEGELSGLIAKPENPYQLKTRVYFERGAPGEITRRRRVQSFTDQQTLLEPVSGLERDTLDLRLTYNIENGNFSVEYVSPFTGELHSAQKIIRPLPAVEPRSAENLGNIYIGESSGAPVFAKDGTRLTDLELNCTVVANFGPARR